jgi:hypothetical protein
MNTVAFGGGAGFAERNTNRPHAHAGRRRARPSAAARLFQSAAEADDESNHTLAKNIEAEMDFRCMRVISKRTLSA